MIEFTQIALAIGIFVMGFLLFLMAKAATVIATRSMITATESGYTQSDALFTRPIWQRWTGLVGTVLIPLLLFTACQPMAQPASTTESTGGAAGSSEGSDAAAQTVTIYSGRNENLVGPLIEQFKTESGIDVQVRYGDTAEMAATILEEGDNSPADLFFAQDAGSLGALAQAGRFSPLPDSILDRVEARFRSPDGLWAGVSGRARVLVYNTDELTEADLPTSVIELTDEKWRGRVGWAPSNGSFQSFVTALRILAGEEGTTAWLEGMIANDVQAYSNNTAIVTAVGAGEISVGLVNHYYLYRFLAEQGESFPARNYYFPAGDSGAMINVAGVGIINTSANTAAAEQFVAFLLTNEAQQFFAGETDEYPLTGEGIEINPLLQPLDDIVTPQLDLNDLADLQGTLELLQEVGALE